MSPRRREPTGEDAVGWIIIAVIFGPIAWACASSWARAWGIYLAGY